MSRIVSWYVTSDRPGKFTNDYTQIRMLLDIAGSSKTHWRYNIVAVRCLRTLVRKDESISAQHFKFFVEKTCDDHPSIVRLPLVSNGDVTLMNA